MRTSCEKNISRDKERTTSAEDTQNQHYQRVRTVVDNWSVLREDKMDHPIFSEYFSLWWSNRMKIHCGWSRRRWFLRCAHKKNNSVRHGRATDNTTLAYISWRMSTLRFLMLERRVVEPAGSFINDKLGWDKTFAQRRRLAPTVTSFRLGARGSSVLRLSRTMMTGIITELIPDKSKSVSATKKFQRSPNLYQYSKKKILDDWKSVSVIKNLNQ